MSARLAFRGGETCSCVATSLPLLETIMILHGLVSNSIDIYQLGWRNNVAASAGTHSQGGCTDIAQLNDPHLAIERKYGWTFQHRTPAQGFSPHAHGWPNGCPHLAPAAQYQQSAWNNGRDGLVSNGPITGPGPIGKNTPHWTEGVQQMRKDIMTIADDIANQVKGAVTRDVVSALLPAINAIPGKTINGVGIPVSDDPKHPASWSLAHIVSWLRRSIASKDQLATVDAKVTDVEAKVNGMVVK